MKLNKMKIPLNGDNDELFSWVRLRFGYASALLWLRLTVYGGFVPVPSFGINFKSIRCGSSGFRNCFARINFLLMAVRGELVTGLILSTAYRYVFLSIYVLIC